MLKIDHSLKPSQLKSKIKKLWDLSADKIESIEKCFTISKGAPVFTIKGKYTSRGWTDWTQGFQWGSAIIQYEATEDKKFCEIGRQKTLQMMSRHITHFGVHDHGFNNVSTYGNLLRLMDENKIGENEWERHYYKLALKCSSAVQAHRWTELNEDEGFIYSFNGPHSLFADTIRSLRILAIGHRLKHFIMGENEAKISLLNRLIKHAFTTAKYTIYYGEDRDAYDVNGRVAHECIFNLNDGSFRCPNTQQGYSPFSTWTRGLAWIMCGYAEQLEFLETVKDQELTFFGDRNRVESVMRRAAQATCDFYIENVPTDGIPYWDTAAPFLYKLGDYLSKPANPYNDYEPVDSSAASIAAQGLLRLGQYLKTKNETDFGNKYWQAGLTILNTLFDEPYLSIENNHQGLILHSIYHRPKGWDYIPAGKKIPCGESSMWGDYHAREVALYLQKIMQKEPYLVFWPQVED
jgi:unsaturated chondroitin disaccharide hydrolase